MTVQPVPTGVPRTQYGTVADIVEGRLQELATVTDNGNGTVTKSSQGFVVDPAYVVTAVNDFLAANPPSHASDPATAGFVSDPGSDTRAALDALYPAKGDVIGPGSTVVADGGRAMLFQQPSGAHDAVKIEHTGTPANPDSAYALKVDKHGEGDNTNITSTDVGGTYTVLAVRGANATRSTLKVTNTTAQTAGAVIAAETLDPARTAPLYTADNVGQGASFRHQPVQGCTGAGFVATWPTTNAAAQTYGPGLWVEGQHVGGNVALIENYQPQTAGGGVLVVAQQHASSTVPALTLGNNGAGPTLAAPSFRVEATGHVSSAAAAPAPYMPNGYFSFYFDAASSEVRVRVRLANGTYSTGVVATVTPEVAP